MRKGCGQANSAWRLWHVASCAAMNASLDLDLLARIGEAQQPAAAAKRSKFAPRARAVRLPVAKRALALAGRCKRAGRAVRARQA